MKNRDDSMLWLPMWVDKWIFGSTRIELEPDERSVWADFLALGAKDNGYIRANIDTEYPPQQLAGLLCITEELLNRTIQKCLDSKINKLQKIDGSAGYKIVHWEEYQLTDRYKRMLLQKIQSNPGNPEQKAQEKEEIKRKFQHYREKEKI